MAKSAERSLGDALTEVFRDDPELYRRYRQDAGQLQAAEREVTEKRVAQHPLADDLLRLAAAFRPHDPTGEGMVMCRRALAELTKTVQAKKRVAA